MKYTKLILLFLSFTASLYSAQPLFRSTFLGLVPETYDTKNAVVIQRLHPVGTAEALGLKVGDQLISVNGIQVLDFQALIEILGSIHEGNAISVEILRAGKKVTLASTAQGRPQEKGKGFKVNYDQFEWQKNHLRTITYTPNKPRADNAAVMYIQGYTCDSIDHGMAPDLTMTQLLASYAAAGFKVFKMEKPGVGDSHGPLDCLKYDFDTENQAFQAGLKHFKSKHHLKAEQVFIFGHSLGVLHGAFFAEQGLAKGVMGYGGVIKPWHDYLKDIFAKQSVKYFGVSPTQAQQNTKLVAPFLHDWIKTNKAWQEVLNTDANKRAQQSELLPLNGDQIFNRHYSFFRSLSQYDFRAMWANSKSHVLMMHGGFDIQAIESGWQNAIANLVNANNPGKGKGVEFPNTEHALMRYADIESLLKAMREGLHRVDQPGDKYNPDIAKTSLKWMQTILNLNS